ncbi:MAG: lysophospholipase [Oligoflexus sp.]|nr:lysophospholipase [Oligoflexus sp.]
MDTSSLTCHFAPVFSKANKHKSPQTPTQAEGFPALPAEWVVEFETIPLEKGHLFAHLFRADSPAASAGREHIAAIVLHGQGEHSGRYLHLAHYLKDVVSSIYAIDHRGHGQSSGNRGHIDSFDEYAEDAVLAIKRYIRYLKERYGKAEIHLIGHSMGGLIALRALQLHPELELASISVTAPMIELAFKVPAIKLLAAKLLYKTLPALSIPGEPLGKLVSRDPAVVKHYKTDPLNHGLASSAFFMTYLAAKEKLKAAAGSLTQPIHFQLPTDDRIIAHQPTVDFFELVGSKDKKKIIYQGLYHELLNEPEKPKVIDDLKQWIKAHSGK